MREMQVRLPKLCADFGKTRNNKGFLDFFAKNEKCSCFFEKDVIQCKGSIFHASFGRFCGGIL